MKKILSCVLSIILVALLSSCGPAESVEAERVSNHPTESITENGRSCDEETESVEDASEEKTESHTEEYCPIPQRSLGSYELFELYEAEGDGWWSEQVNDVKKYAWSQALSVWNSYLSVYESTKETKWLKKISMQIDDLLMHRDHLMGRVDWRGYSLPSWSSTNDPEKYDPYHQPVLIGLLVYPILRFTEIVRSDQLEHYYDEADRYLQAALDALAVLDHDIWKYNPASSIPEEACLDLWREEKEAYGTIGYYVGHLYYAEPYFAERRYLPDQMLPYNQSLSVAMCFPVLYRITKDDIWKEKTQCSWRWLYNDIVKDEIWWWYYSRYYNWCRVDRILSTEAPVPENKSSFYEDYRGHYSIDILFVIEGHKIGAVSDEDLLKISENKKKMGLSGDGWKETMNVDAAGGNNLQAAAFFDYFALCTQDTEYRDIVYPVLSKVVEEQYKRNRLADPSTGVNGTCLRLIASAIKLERSE